MASSKTRKDNNRYIRLFLTGFSMGTADLIPGVSGGTIAFLSGIYEELLQSIKTMSGEFLRLLLKRRIQEAISVVPFKFLIPLAVGLFVALFALAQLLTFLLAEYPSFVWAFFFGLVLASTWIVLKRVVKWNIIDYVAFGISAVVMYIIVGAIPIETPTNPFFVFGSGMLAICAMILPGISGSFILLLLGKYQQILAAVTERDLLTLGIFMAGCIIGLALFSRVLTWLFREHHDISVAILSGLMLGSLRKIWPWKEIVLTRVNSHGEVVPLVEKNILPGSMDSGVLFAVVLIVCGAGLVLFLERMNVMKEHAGDIEDKDFKKEHEKSLLEEKKK